MEPLIQISAIGAPLRLANVNTDQLFPARFIKKPRAVGYAQYLFHDIRRTDAGDINPNFPLNDAKFETLYEIKRRANQFRKHWTSLKRRESQSTSIRNA